MKKPSERIQELLDTGEYKLSQAVGKVLDEWYIPPTPYEPIEPPTRLIKESKDVPENEFEKWHTQGWNDLHQQILKLKAKHFSEHIDVNLMESAQFFEKIKKMWEEFKGMKKWK